MYRFVTVLSLALAACTVTPPAARKPNLLFIMVDDLGKDWVSCYGADAIETPQIDALAQSGMKFTRAWSMPQCTPTRVALLTGQYPWRNGWVNHWDVPRWGVGWFDWQRNMTFARILKAAGYATAIAGKWQINDFRVAPDALAKHGFDDWCVWTGYESGNSKSAKRYQDAYVHTRAGSRTAKGKFGPDVYCDFLIDFMERHRNEPMLLYFPMCLTHGPWVPTPDEPDVRGRRAKHEAMVRYTDKLVGRLVKALRELDLRDDTVIFFTTDNGTSRSLLGAIRGKKPSGGKADKFEGGICEPFIASWPGRIKAGATSNALVDFTDMLPTFAELGRARVPPDWTIDGHSFAKVLLGTSQKGARDWIMALGHGAARVDAEGVRGKHDYTDRVIRGARFKVWVGTNKKIEALYDLETDPLERTNLLGSNDPLHRAALAKFEAVVATTPDRDARPRYRKRKKRLRHSFPARDVDS